MGALRHQTAFNIRERAGGRKQEPMLGLSWADNRAVRWLDGTLLTN